MIMKATSLNEIIQETKDRDIKEFGALPHDSINPNYYKVGGIETIDYMRAKSTPEEFRGHLRLTALKYLSRVGHKDEILKEYKKAQWYLNKLVEEVEKCLKQN
jgi:hypothetical protein